MKYMLLIYWKPSEMPRYSPEEQQANAKAWHGLTMEMQSAGVLVANDGLAPVGDAKTVRIRDGQTLTADGPFAETHEHLGGYYMIECRDMDEALAWAAKVPTAEFGSVEVRPLNIYSQARDEAARKA